MPLPSSEPEVHLLRTSAISSDLKQQFCQLFETVFEKQFSPDLFDRKYLRVPGCDSYHAFLIAGGVLLGAYSAIPMTYSVRGVVHEAALPVDMMIHPDLRPAVGELKQMMDELYGALADAGKSFLVVLLRKNIFRLHSRMGQMKEIGPLAYHVAPARRSVLARTILPFLVNRSPSPAAGDHSNIERVLHESRYQLFPSDYRKVQLANGKVVTYVREPYFPIGGVPSFVRVAYIVDVPSPVNQSLDECVALISAQERGLHAIFYLGLKGLQSRYFRELVPKYQKPVWCAAIKLLPAGVAASEALLDAGSWNLSLGDSDLM